MELAHYREVVERIRDGGVDAIVDPTTAPGQRITPSKARTSLARMMIVEG
jgi:uncharacterized protein (DUF849 family)